MGHLPRTDTPVHYWPPYVQGSQPAAAADRMDRAVRVEIGRARTRSRRPVSSARTLHADGGQASIQAPYVRPRRIHLVVVVPTLPIATEVVAS
jgi:hypothetical protein